MKRLMAIAALLVAFPALSEINCEYISKYAHEVMTKRQNEEPITDVIKEASSDSERVVVIEAYKKPSFTSEKVKNRSIKSFVNMIATACYINNN